MKGYKIIALVCWSFVALLLVWILITALLGRGLFAAEGPLSDFGHFSWGNSEEVTMTNGLVGDGVISAGQEEISKINVDWVSGSVDVHTYDGSEVKWEERSSKTLSDDQKLRYKIENGRLTIQAFPNRGWSVFNFGKSRPSKTLELWVPEGMTLDSLVLDASSAKMECDGVSAKRVEMNTASGSQKISGCTAKVLQMNAASGDITVIDVVSDEIAMGTASGRQEITGCRVENLQMNTASGDVTVTNVVSDEMAVGTASGRQEITGCRTENLQIHSVSGDVAAQGHFEKVDLETVSGSLRVRSEVMLKDLNVETVSGAVTIAIPENDGFTLDYSKVSGGLDSDFAMNSRGGDYVYGNGQADFEVDSVSGDLYISRIESEDSSGTGRGRSDE